MPSQPYDLVKDEQDSRVPLYPEQAFYGNGISFPARLIGWQTVARPSSRTEIVQAMRRIRYECKVQNAKKRKITFLISVDGVKVNMKRKKRKKKHHWNEPPELEILNHPIYRIFYVSHDSNDLKIFSYIARDGSSDVFRCCVFKTNKKSQAMRIVRTVGQAFEVCHKLSLQDSVEIADEPSEASLCDFSDQDKISDEENIKKDIISESREVNLPGKINKTEMSSTSNIFSSQPSSQENGNEPTLKKTPLSTSQEVVCLREQLDQQQLQTRQVVAQLMLVRDQLISETNARIEAQARTQQLLQQNRELLEHIASIGGYHEPDRPGLSSTAIGLAPQYSYFQNHQINDLLNMGGLGKHFQTVQPLSPNTNPAMGPMQQSLNNVNSGSFSALNKLHNMSAFQPASNLMSPAANLTVQDLYKLNQNILNQLTNVNYNPLYTLYPTANVNSTQQQPNSFIFSNQNATGFNNIASMTNTGTSNTESSQAGSATFGEHHKPSPSTKSTSDSRERFTSQGSISVAQEGKDSRTQFIKPLSQVGTLTTMDADGKIKVIVPMDKEQLELPKALSRKATSFSELSGDTSVEGSTKSISILKDSKDKKSSIPSLVTLKVTDESGTSTRRLPATPSFITRSTSEKVPNRSQIMSQVQRTQWARHTTK